LIVVGIIFITFLLIIFSLEAQIKSLSTNVIKNQVDDRIFTIQFLLWFNNIILPASSFSKSNHEVSSSFVVYDCYFELQTVKLLFFSLLDLNCSQMMLSLFNIDILNFQLQICCDPKCKVNFFITLSLCFSGCRFPSSIIENALNRFTIIYSYCLFPGLKIEYCSC
jgi:hypothetical protein